MDDQANRNEERCGEWSASLEMLRQNPVYSSSLSVSSEDLKFAADTSALPPNVLLLAAMHFALNLRSPIGVILLLCILADIVFRPEPPTKKGRPRGTKKWNERKVLTLGFRGAAIKARNPSFGYEAIAGELIKTFGEYRISRTPPATAANCHAGP